MAQFMEAFTSSVPSGVDYYGKWPVEDMFNFIHRVRHTSGDQTAIRIVIFHVQRVYGTLQCTISGKPLVTGSVHLGERYDLMEKCHKPSTTGTIRSKKLVAIYAYFPQGTHAEQIVKRYKAMISENVADGGDYTYCLRTVANLLVEAGKDSRANGEEYNISISHDMFDTQSPFFSEEFNDIYSAHEHEVFLNPRSV